MYVIGVRRWWDTCVDACCGYEKGSNPDTTGVSSTSLIFEPIAKRLYFRNTLCREKRKQLKLRGNARPLLVIKCGKREKKKDTSRIKSTDRICLCLSAYRLHPLQQDIFGGSVGWRGRRRRTLYRSHEIPRRLLHRVLPFWIAFGRAFRASTCKIYLISCFAKNLEYIEQSESITCSVWFAPL